MFCQRILCIYLSCNKSVYLCICFNHLFIYFSDYIIIYITVFVYAYLPIFLFISLSHIQIICLSPVYVIHFFFITFRKKNPPASSEMYAFCKGLTPHPFPSFSIWHRRPGRLPLHHSALIEDPEIFMSLLASQSLSGDLL